MATDKILIHQHYREDPLNQLQDAHLDYQPWLEAMHALYQGEDAPSVPNSRANSVEAFVNAGRWLWNCVACNSAICAENNTTTPSSSTGHPSICVQCGGQGWVDVIFPTNRTAIEAELLKQPGHRGHAPVRHWKPGWTLTYLQERTAKAQALRDAGVEFIRKLSIGSSRVWAVGEILTAANMNTYVSGVDDDEAGRNGPVEYEGAIVIDSLTTTERDTLVLTGTGGLGASGNGLVIYNSTLSVFQRYENGAWVSYTDLAAMTIGSAAQGDVLYIASGGNITRLGAGTDRQTLRTHGISANPSFADLEDLRVAATTARGDVFFIGSNGRMNRLAPGTANDFLQTKGASADPVWSGIPAAAFQRFTTNGTYTVPTAARMVFVEVVGGGGGGGNATSTQGGTAGQGGLVSRNMFLASALGTTVTVTVGAGGTAGVGGANSSFGTLAVGLGGPSSTILYEWPMAHGQKGANGGTSGLNNPGIAGAAGIPTTLGGGAGGAAGTSGNNGGAGGAGSNSTNGLGSGGGGWNPGGGNNGNNGGNGGAGGIPGGGGGGTGGLNASHGTGGTGGGKARYGFGHGSPNATSAECRHWRQTRG